MWHPSNAAGVTVAAPKLNTYAFNPQNRAGRPGLAVPGSNSPSEPIAGRSIQPPAEQQGAARGRSSEEFGFATDGLAALPSAKDLAEVPPPPALKPNVAMGLETLRTDPSSTAGIGGGMGGMGAGMGGKPVSTMERALPPRPRTHTRSLKDSRPSHSEAGANPPATAGQLRKEPDWNSCVRTWNACTTI